MNKVRKVPKNFEFEMVGLAIIVRRDFTFDVAPLRIKTDFYSLKGLNADRLRTRNKGLYKFLKAQNSQKKRTEQLRRMKVLFD